MSWFGYPMAAVLIPARQMHGFESSQLRRAHGCFRQPGPGTTVRRRAPAILPRSTSAFRSPEDMREAQLQFAGRECGQE